MHKTWPLLLVLVGCQTYEPIEPTDTEETDTEVQVVDEDDDGFAAEVDCDDTNPDVNPDADEVCNGLDDNCNDRIDDEDPWLIGGELFYADDDGDGYGDPDDITEACLAPSGFVEDATDCDDHDAKYNPGAVEDDCTDPNDYNCDGSVMYEDLDGDGFAACEECDDADGDIHPSATELCDGIDNDCDDLIDDADDSITGQQTFYADADADGYGDASSTVAACEMPSGYGTDAQDCDDTSAEISPAATELCDTVDNDCDGKIDDADSSLADGTTYYKDADGDGFGNEKLDSYACSQPTGYVTDATDCNDSYDGAYPGADEVCDGLDNDCDELSDDEDDDVDGLLEWYIDADDDGYGDGTTEVYEACAAPTGYVADDADCDDDDDLINPGVAFDWGDGFDNDCDDDVDEDVGYETVTHDVDIQAIWDTSCTSCHGTSSPSGDLTLEDAYELIVSVPSSDVPSMNLIEPGDPSRSYLWHKLRGTHTTVGGAGSTMPVSGTLSTEDQQAIKTWILEGAVQ